MSFYEDNPSISMSFYEDNPDHHSSYDYLSPIRILMPDPYLRPESTEWLMEEQAFLLSYVSAPGPHPSPLFRQQLVSLSQSSNVSTVEISDGGEGVVSQVQVILPRESLALY